MKTTIKHIFTGILLFACSALFSCNAWLSVDAEDRIMEDELFKSREGFLTALNGVYSELNISSLYGSNLTAVLDVMAQYYEQTVDGPYRNYFSYGMSSAHYKNLGSGIWQNAYALIANVNAIVEHCGDGNPVLPDTYYGIVKGEAIALRAMLHLDLLRLFGPIWSEDDGIKTYMPYMTRADRKVQPLLTAPKLMENILADLDEASRLLADVDPVRTNGANVPGSAIVTNDLYYRQFRLNYFAVKALRARALLWSNNTAEAGKVARELIAEASQARSEEEPALFPLINNQYMEVYTDRVFSPEVLFSLYNTSREKKYKDVYGSDLPIGIRLTLFGDYTEGRINYIYDDKNDQRYKMWLTGVKDNKEFVYNTKFATVSSNAVTQNKPFINYMMPLIRMSEIYLIAAECDPSTASGVENYLNPLRKSRNCLDISTESADVASVIRAEYMREFIGEGQLFYYFKRFGLENIPNGSKADDVMNFDKSNYIFLLPDSETSQRGM